MWAIFAVIVAALVLYALERIPLVLTSLGVICTLAVLFHFVPVIDETGANRLGAKQLLAGFANPALLAVVGLLVMGQGLAATGVLERGAGLVLRLARGNAALALALVLITVLAVSGFLNNTPVVVIFIPIMQTLSERLDRSPSRMMMPLSFAAILGGMTTLIGSSTNLLVSGTLVEMGRPGFGFFDFTLPGIVLAAVGLVYLVTIAPRLMPSRALLTTALTGGGRQFIAQISVTEGSRFDGLAPLGGYFPQLVEVTLRILQRGEHAFVPPFDDELTLVPGDILVVAATRKALTDLLGDETDLLHPDLGDEPEGEAEAEDEPRRWQAGSQTLVEVMVTPTSRLIGRTLEQIGFRYHTHCIVVGLQRQSRMIRSRITEIRLAGGDVLLIQGRKEDIDALRGNPDVLLIEWSAADLPSVHHARRALAIFGAVIATAALGILPISIAALSGAGLMLAANVLNIRQAGRAIDRNVVMMIAAALALGLAMQETGGADFLAVVLLESAGDFGPASVLSGFFLLVAVLSNLINAKATAVLFTPIAVSIATGLGVPVEPFAVAVVFAANCSFASPVGYQTNLLVMAPGNYRFLDFTRAGAPLVIVVWLAFSLFAPWYYGL
ncbi:MAG: SLC13 family permease [Alphaproteobacteria bacterium]|nr:SLC13 family permease [Alphaproteobacteria bacterium]